MLCSLFGKPQVLDDDQVVARNVVVEKQGSPSASTWSRQRVEDLRAAIREAKLDYYVIPSEDEHQSEWVGDSEKRREWISGFSGSAGQAVVSSSQALLFVDSRYWVQAGRQVDQSLWTIVRVGDDGAKMWTDWAAEDLDEGVRIGIDPYLISYATADSLKSRLTKRHSSLIYPKSNLVDYINPSRPARSLAPITHHPICFSGKATAVKLADLRKTLPTPHHIYVLPVLPSIAWLLNIRCQGDIPFVPVAYAYVAVSQTKCVIFFESRKVQDPELRKCWESEGIEVREYGLDKLVEWVREQGDKAKVLAPKESSFALVDKIGENHVELVACPVEIAKAIKNKTEQQGFRNAYLRDGRATIRWMSWLDCEIRRGTRIGEWEAGEKLNDFRSMEEHFAGLAYENISASGPNGALPHYSPEQGKDRLIDTKSTYVIDAGAQYRDGTIDTTRTLYFGRKAPDDVKRAFTRVLQGHIAIDTAVFPSGTSGEKLDILARQPLWRDHKDFGHGVGHGVGSFLAVHEGPCGIPKPAILKPGHTISNEPGFYLEAQWGIRLESIVMCKVLREASTPQGKSWFGWERVTQVPIQRSLVDESLLSKTELVWLKAHNQGVKEALLPLLTSNSDRDVRKYLLRACR